MKTAPKLAKEYGVRAVTLRRWHESGLCPARGERNKHLRYTEFDERRLQAVLELRQHISSRRALWVLKVLQRNGLLVTGEDVLA